MIGVRQMSKSFCYKRSSSPLQKHHLRRVEPGFQVENIWVDSWCHDLKCHGFFLTWMNDIMVITFQPQHPGSNSAPNTPACKRQLLPRLSPIYLLGQILHVFHYDRNIQTMRTPFKSGLCAF